MNNESTDNEIVRNSSKSLSFEGSKYICFVLLLLSLVSR